MKRAPRAATTRSGLLQCRRRLRQVARGTVLLKRKRQALVDELFSRARRAITSREAIEAQARRAWQAAWPALSALGTDAARPLGWPTREIEVEVSAVDLWGVRVAQLGDRTPLVRSLAARGVLGAADEVASQAAAAEVERLLEQVLHVAPEEHVMRQLGQALARTTRLVHTLEQRVTADLSNEIGRIERTLGEREREEHLRIKRLVARRTRAARQP